MTHCSAALQNLLVYRHILNDELLQKITRLNSSDDVFSCEAASGLIEKMESLGLEGNALHNYLVYLICHDSNTFSTSCEKNCGRIGPSLSDAVLTDIATIKTFLYHDFPSLPAADLLTNYTPTDIRPNHDFTNIVKAFLDDTPEEVLECIKKYYIQHGYGDIAGYRFFRWSEHHKLTGITHYDAVTLADLIGYEHQKQVLTTNIVAFLSNKPCHDVLLVGARGTGKSSSVKALVNEYHAEGLRLVEVPKHALKDIPIIMDTLRKYGKRFIVFLDDLSFEETELEYKYLKSVLEGGVELKPENVMICATSNRRHIIRETWQDRAGDSEDIHRFDSVHEKLSLSDRFGITLSFLTPSQEEYVHIIEELAKKNHLPLSSAQLRLEAIQWEMSHSGRSGRTAHQLITHLSGKQP